MAKDVAARHSHTFQDHDRDRGDQFQNQALFLRVGESHQGQGPRLDTCNQVQRPHARWEGDGLEKRGFQGADTMTIGGLVRSTRTWKRRKGGRQLIAAGIGS